MSKKIIPLLNVTPEVYPALVRVSGNLLYDGYGNLIPISSQPSILVI